MKRFTNRSLTGLMALGAFALVSQLAVSAPRRTTEDVRPRGVRLRRGLGDFRQDLAFMARGILDPRSFRSGYEFHLNPVELIARSPHKDGTPCHAHAEGTVCMGLVCTDCSCRTPGRIKAIRRTHNIRTNGGGDATVWGLSGTPHAGRTSVGTPTATTLPDSGAAFGTTQYIGKIVTSGTVYGVIISHTNTVLTVERWIDGASATDATGTTPGVNAIYCIVPGNAPAYYLAVSNDATTPNRSDTTLTGEISTNGFLRALAAFQASGGGAYVNQSGSGTTNQSNAYQLVKTWTSSGGSTSAQKCGMFNVLTAGIMFFENTFTAITGLISGDTLQLTWTVTV